MIDSSANIFVVIRATNPAAGFFHYFVLKKVINIFFMIKIKTYLTQQNLRSIYIIISTVILTIAKFMKKTLHYRL